MGIPICAFGNVLFAEEELGGEIQPCGWMRVVDSQRLLTKSKTRKMHFKNMLSFTEPSPSHQQGLCSWLQRKRDTHVEAIILCIIPLQAGDSFMNTIRKININVNQQGCVFFFFIPISTPSPPRPLRNTEDLAILCIALSPNT